MHPKAAGGGSIIFLVLIVFLLMALIALVIAVVCVKVRKASKVVLPVQKPVIFDGKSIDEVVAKLGNYTNSYVKVIDGKVYHVYQWSGAGSYMFDDKNICLGRYNE